MLNSFSDLSKSNRMEEILRFLIPLVVNDTYACDNDKVLNGLLKTELGFEGCAPTLSLSACVLG